MTTMRSLTKSFSNKLDIVKSDPYVRVIGQPESVHDAANKVRYELQPHNKITMKLDVSWTCHSHIIGKGGNTIQPVVKRTGVSIHFPDGNKNSDVHKSNQVSINSRGEELNGLEEARSAIRDLTPIVFSFSLPATAQFIVTTVDPNILLVQVHNTYNVQAKLQLINEELPEIVGSVKGAEWDATRVKEATLFLLHALCGNLANQMPVQITVEISPQHHAFILGRNKEVVRKIMQRTATKIIFPDANDSSLSPLKKSTIRITGAIENVYQAKQNIVGCLPLVLMFDLLPEQSVDQLEIYQIMQSLDVCVMVRNKRIDLRRSVTIKGAERDASNIYEAWRLLTKSMTAIPKAKIPHTYNLCDLPPTHGIGNCQVGPFSCSSIYGSHFDSVLPHTLPGYCCSDLLQSLSLLENNNDLNLQNNNYLDKRGNNAFTDRKFAKIDEECLNGNDIFGSCNGCSEESLYEDPSITIANHIHGIASRCPSRDNFSFEELDSILPLIPDRRAPGSQKKLNENFYNITDPDYFTKKLLAAKVMKQPVSPNPRTPTSSWSGYGFSKSMPGYVISQLMKAEKAKANESKGLDGWFKEDSNSSSYSSSGSELFPMSSNKVTFNLGENLSKVKSDMSASNYIDSVLQLPMSYNYSGFPSDINSILANLQMEQYSDLFASQDVDLETFCNLNDNDLRDLGVLMFGHRKKLLLAIKNLCVEKERVSQRVSCDNFSNFDTSSLRTIDFSTFSQTETANNGHFN